MIISNTEVTMFNTCKRQHYYRFGLNIEPQFIFLSRALQRGIVGHTALEAYYNAMMSGASVEECRAAAISIIKLEISSLVTTHPEEYEILQVISGLVPLIEGYSEFYRQETFRPLKVEAKFQAPVGQDIAYALKLDVLGEFTRGVYRGDLVVVDHKFVYNFKTAVELDMDGQLLKYVKTCKEDGYPVTKGMFNQIRYRPMKNPGPNDIYRRDIVKATKTETETIWREQEISAKDIYYYKQMPLDEWREFAVRNQNPMICRGCSFATLCKEERQGQDISKTLVLNYQPNTYGYGELIADD